MLPTSAGVEPATSWSPVGRRIQLSHRGRLTTTTATTTTTIIIITIIIIIIITDERRNAVELNCFAP